LKKHFLKGESKQNFKKIKYKKVVLSADLSYLIMSD